MGLDMYLNAEKYLSSFDSEDKQKITTLNEMFDFEGDTDEDYYAQSVLFRVAYWRKANAIHQWFVNNCQDGIDECQKAYVSREQLVELLELCNQIIANPKKAPELLPTASGFFFGSTDYDNYYKQDVKHTADRLSKILTDPALESGVDFYYQSSW